MSGLRSIVERHEINWESFWEELSLKLEDGMTAQNFGEVWILDHGEAYSECADAREYFNVDNLQPVFVSENRPKSKI